MEDRFIFGETKERIDEKDQFPVVSVALNTLRIADEIVMATALMRPMKP